MVALTLAFAAGTVLHAARATVMDLTMAGLSSAMLMPGCDGCGDDSDDRQDAVMAACFGLCATPVMASLPVQLLQPTVVSALPSAVGRPIPRGRTGPPDPYPPRIIA